MDTDAKLAKLKQFRGTMEGRNHFELLGVDETADDNAVRSAYFELIKKYGADHFHHVVEQEAREAIDDVNKRLRAAYDAIGRKPKRDAYLEKLHGGGQTGDQDMQIDIAKVFECEQAMQQARTLMERGEFGIAGQKLEKAREIDPKSPEIKVRLAYVRLMKMKVDANGERDKNEVRYIKEEMEALSESLPNADYLYVYLGDIEEILGSTDKAVEQYKKAIEINADNLPAQRQLRLIEERKKRAREESEAPKSFFERIKAMLTKKL